MASFFFFVFLHTAFSGLSFTPFFPYFFVYFFPDFLFHQLSSLFCISVSPLRVWHWTCGGGLLSAAVGSASVYRPPCSSGAGSRGKSTTRSDSRSKQTKYIHFMSWASDSSEEQSEPVTGHRDLNLPLNTSVRLSPDVKAGARAEARSWSWWIYQVGEGVCISPRATLLILNLLR